MITRREVDVNVAFTVKLDPALIALVSRVLDAADRDWSDVNRQLTAIRDSHRPAAQEPAKEK